MSQDLFKQIIRKHLSNRSSNNSSNKEWFSDYLIVIGQLLVWQKITEDNWLEEHQKFSTLPYDAKHKTIKQILSTLAKEGPEHCRDVFQRSTSRFYQIPEETLSATIALLLAAHEQKLLAHEEVVPLLIQQLEGTDHYPVSLPDELIRLMYLLAEIKTDSRIYSPFISSLSLSLEAEDRHDNLHTELVTNSPFPAICNVLLNAPVDLQYNDPIHSPGWIEPGGLRQFDVSLTVLPQDKTVDKETISDLYARFPEGSYSPEIMAMFHTLSQTSERAVILVSQSFLQRTTQKEKLIKQALLNKKQLKTIISLPAVFNHSKYPSMAIMVFDKTSDQKHITFIDANHEYFKAQPLNSTKSIRLRNITTLVEQSASSSNDRFSRQIPLDEIVKNNFNLQVSRYVIPHHQIQFKKLLESRDTQPLSEIAELIRGQAIKNHNGIDGESFLEVLVNDLNEAGEVENPEKNIRAFEHLKRARHQQLQPGDILLVVKGQVGTVGIVPQLCSSNWIASQAFIIVRLKNTAFIKDPSVLFRYLNSPLGQTLISQIKTGDSVPILHTEDIQNLAIPVMGQEEQDQAIKTHQDIKKVHAEIRFLKDKAWNINRKVWSL